MEDLSSGVRGYNTVVHVINLKTPQSPAQCNTKVGKQLGCQGCLLGGLNFVLFSVMAESGLVSSVMYLASYRCHIFQSDEQPHKQLNPLVREPV